MGWDGMGWDGMGWARGGEHYLPTVEIPLPGKGNYL
jgi:hypothetical protein